MGAHTVPLLGGEAQPRMLRAVWAHTLPLYSGGGITQNATCGMGAPPPLYSGGSITQKATGMGAHPSPLLGRRHNPGCYVRALGAWHAERRNQTLLSGTSWDHLRVQRLSAPLLYLDVTPLKCNLGPVRDRFEAIRSRLGPLLGLSGAALLSIPLPASTST